MLVYDLPNNPITGLQEKAHMEQLFWQLKAKFIKIEFWIKSYDAQGNYVGKAVPDRYYFLMASTSKYRMPDGSSVQLNVDEHGGATLPDEAITEYDFFKNLNGLEETINTIVNTQLAIKIQEQGSF